MGVEDEITYFKELVSNSRRENLLTINMKVDILLSAAMFYLGRLEILVSSYIGAVKLFAS